MAVRLKMKSCVKGAIKGVAVSVRGDFLGGKISRDFFYFLFFGF